MADSIAPDSTDLLILGVAASSVSIISFSNPASQSPDILFTHRPSNLKIFRRLPRL